MIIQAKFASTYTFTLVKWVFFGLFPLPQNLKMVIYKGYRVSGKSKKAKKNVVIAVFSKIDARLKGISEGGLKALQIKAFRGSN